MPKNSMLSAVLINEYIAITKADLSAEHLILA